MMYAELHEQPDALQRLLDAAQSALSADFARARDLLRGSQSLVLMGCGSSYHAARAAAQSLRTLTGISATAIVASEVTADPSLLSHASHVVCVSQSGETADTLQALTIARARHLPVVAVLSDGASTMARASDVALVTQSGPERAIPSTKGFSCQLVTLWALAIALSNAADVHQRALATLPRLARATLACGDAIAQLAADIASAPSLVFLGTGPGYAIALEGALKMKESARIPAQGYPALEVRHGPLAALGADTPALIWHDGFTRADAILDLTQHLRKCGVPTILLAPKSAATRFADAVDTFVALPQAQELVAPAMGAIAFQLLAYHAACALGRDMDAPPNLVKSVI